MSLTEIKKDSTHAIKALWYLIGEEIRICMDFVLLYDVVGNYTILTVSP